MEGSERRERPRRVRIPFAAAAPILLLCAGVGQILYGELIPVGGGLGWDGRFYAEAAAHLPSALSEGSVDAYRARRLVPSALVWLVLQGSGLPPDAAHARDVFAWVNLGLELLILAAWTAAARRSGIGEGGLWLGFVLLFFNFANLKMPFYYAPLTDTCAQALGAALLYFHVARRPRGMILVLATGAFTWPTLLAFGAFLFVYPPGAPSSSSPSPAGWRAVVAGGIAAAFAALVLANRADVVQQGGGLLAAAIALAYLVRVAADLAAGQALAPRAVFARPALARWTGVAALAAAVSVATRALTAPALIDTGYVLRGLAIYSLARPGVFLVAHGAYFGLVVPVLVVFWPQVVAVAHRMGTGITLFLLAHLVWGVHSESRQIVDGLPALVLVAVAAASTVRWPRATVPVAAALALIASKAWFPINHEGFMGRSDPASFPAQYYFMNQGPWMAGRSYVMQALALIAACTLVWMARKQASAGPAEVVRARPRPGAAALAAGLASAVILVEIILGASLLLARQGPPVGVDEAIRAADGRPESMLAASLRSAERRGDDLRRLPLPSSWQGAPLVSVLAFVDGRPVPFSVGEPVDSPGARAFTRSLRAGAVLIRCAPDAPCADVVLVRPDRSMTLVIGWRRLMATPTVVVPLAVIAAIWSSLVALTIRRRSALSPWAQTAIVVAVSAIGMALGLGTARAILTLAVAGSLWLAAPVVGSGARRPTGLK